MNTRQRHIERCIEHVALAVSLVWRVSAVGCEMRVLGDLEGETLAVGDVPMEGVDLDPAHIVEGPEKVEGGVGGEGGGGTVCGDGENVFFAAGAERLDSLR